MGAPPSFRGPPSLPAGCLPSDSMQTDAPECGICLDAYDRDARAPRRLPCADQHVLCQGCVDGIWRADGRAGFCCPYCRKFVPIQEFPLALARPGPPRRETVDEGGGCDVGWAGPDAPDVFRQTTTAESAPRLDRVAARLAAAVGTSHRWLRAMCDVLRPELLEPLWRAGVAEAEVVDRVTQTGPRRPEPERGGPVAGCWCLRALNSRPPMRWPRRRTSTSWQTSRPWRTATTPPRCLRPSSPACGRAGAPGRRCPPSLVRACRHTGGSRRHCGGAPGTMRWMTTTTTMTPGAGWPRGGRCRGAF